MVDQLLVPLRLYLTLYPVMLAPPLELGADHEMVKVFSSALVLAFLGALGAEAVVVVRVTVAVYNPVPATLIAATLIS